VLWTDTPMLCTSLNRKRDRMFPEILEWHKARIEQSQKVNGKAKIARAVEKHCYRCEFWNYCDHQLARLPDGKLCPFKNFPILDDVAEPKEA
jgi:hypothetical protein